MAKQILYFFFSHIFGLNQYFSYVNYEYYK